MREYQQRINQILSANVQDDQYLLHQAMRYSVLGGGKRIRALLVYGAGELGKTSEDSLDNAACAVELVHAYSLIHDDLPAMDNDDLRHGQPSCHKKFNEAIAILAGDALQSLAFAILAKNNNAEMLGILSNAIGPAGMAFGQSLDLAAEKQQITIEQLMQIHQYKTGALIKASVQLGALASNVDVNIFTILTSFAEKLGLAFQIQDDILDVTSSTKVLGKTQGADAAHHKATYPSLLGLETAKQKAQENFKQAFDYLKQLSSPKLLTELTTFIAQRNY